MPDVEGCKEFRCELTRTPYGRRFINEVCLPITILFALLLQFMILVSPFISDLVVVFLFNLQELNSYLKFLFELIAARGPDVGINLSLSRYDFFHGHLFLARETGRLGIL